MGCAVITGPYVHHFTEVFEELEVAGGVIRAVDEMAVTKAVATLLTNGAKRAEMAASGLKAVEAHQGVLERVLGVLDPYLRRAE
jgi:3-deoxy-D-manno-octulosonic-acid transferase